MKVLKELGIRYSPSRKIHSSAVALPPIPNFLFKDHEILRYHGHE